MSRYVVHALGYKAVFDLAHEFVGLFGQTERENLSAISMVPIRPCQNIPYAAECAQGVQRILYTPPTVPRS